jgi:hypothetical protein
MLVCAILASLASGVLAAYGICYAMFAFFRIHARHVAARSQGNLVTAPPALEG